MLIGIVGKPSSGKSTFLNAACLTNAKVANYPFTTIEPNLGTSYVKTKCVCSELNLKDNPKNSFCTNGLRFIPIKMLDVAGLVPDAHLGRGKGNKFLTDLVRADALIHVVDVSGSLDAGGVEIDEGTRDPIEDIKFLEDEINYWFKDIIVHQDWQKMVRKVKTEKLSFVDLLYEKISGFSIKKEAIPLAMKKSGLNFDKIDVWTEDELFKFAKTLREITKPILIAANKIDKKNGEQNFKKLQENYKETIFPCSGLAEFWLRKYEQKGVIQYIPGDNDFKIIKKEELTEQDLKALDTLKLKILQKHGSTGIQNILNYAIFNLLDQIAVYPVYDAQKFTDKDGNVLPDAHLVKKGMPVREFVAEKIHSDLAKNFIYAINAKTKMRLGEDYPLQNCDVIKIVSASK